MTEAEKTYEMNWDCEYCGAKKLLGVTHRFCPECGAAQNPTKRYFPPENEKVAVQDHKYVGADVACPACKQPQSGAVKHCTNCGSPLTGGGQVHRQADHVVGPGGVPMQAAAAAAPQKKSYTGCIIAVVAVVVIIIGIIIVNACWTRSAGLEVAKLSWTREIEIERYEEIEDKEPCKDVPEDATIVQRHKAEPVCKTRKVDKGDGTFTEKKECTEPVEQCTYKAKKWKIARTLKESGSPDEKPEWPDVKLSRTGTSIGSEREGKRTEKYTVHFTDSKSKDEHTCDFDSKAKWDEYPKGSKWIGEVGGLAGDLKCDKLKKAK